MQGKVLKGGCLCGRVTIETRGEPRFVSQCHCNSCRRASSAPSVAWAGFRDEQVTLSGDNLRSFASSPGVSRFFCGVCGSPIAFRGAAWPGETHIPVCALEEADALPPTSDHFAEEKLSWSKLIAAATHGP